MKGFGGTKIKGGGGQVSYTVIEPPNYTHNNQTLESDPFNTMEHNDKICLCDHSLVHCIILQKSQHKRNQVVYPTPHPEFRLNESTHFINRRYKIIGKFSAHCTRAVQ